MGFRFNPFTGQLDLDGAAAGGSGSYNVDRITISAAQESAKEVTLSQAPTTATSTILLVQGGPNQFYGDDFTVSGTTLSWSGLGLDGFLVEGDKITVLFD